MNTPQLKPAEKIGSWVVLLVLLVYPKSTDKKKKKQKAMVCSAVQWNTRAAKTETRRELRPQKTKAQHALHILVASLPLFSSFSISVFFFLYPRACTQKTAVQHAEENDSFGLCKRRWTELHTTGK
jgi:hypothetical protein